MGRKLRMSVLEPRILLDAAAVATVAAEATKPTDHADSSAPDLNTQSSASDSSADQPVLPSSAPHQDGRTVVVIDARVSNFQEILESLPTNAEAIVIDADTSGIEAVAQALGSGGDVSSLHVISHGISGGFVLGSSLIDSASLAGDIGKGVAAWSAGLADGADLMLYGCDIGQGAAGMDFLSRMAWLTGADVAASSDATGAASQGGDWDLEVQVGAVNMMAALTGNELFGWQGLLAAPSIGGAPDKASIVEPSAINSADSDSQYTFSGITITDGGGSSVTVTVTVGDPTAGKLINFGSATGTDTSRTFTGTSAQVNSWLSGLTFQALDSAKLDSGSSVTTDITITAVGGGFTASHKIGMTITASNDPTSLPDGAMTVLEGSTGTTVTGITLNIADPEVAAGNQSADQIIYRLLDLPMHGYLTVGGQRIGVGSIFSHQDVLDGKVKYVHTATGALQNASDFFRVTVNDGATPQAYSDLRPARIDISITPVNQAPTASGSGIVYEGQPENAQNANTANGGVTYTPIGMMITGDDGGDPNDSLTLWINSLPTSGKLYFNGTELTADDVGGAGFRIEWSDRALLTFRHDGRGAQDLTLPGPASISIGYTVTDAFNGTTGQKTLTLTVMEVNDDPVWVPESSLAATVPNDGSYRVTLDKNMLQAMDVDSTNKEITFTLTELAAKGQVWLNGNALGVGATFSMDDVLNGRVSFLQTAGAAAGETASFKFVVLDNALSLRWAASGEDYERPGGIYNDGSDTLKEFTFVVNLLETSNGGTAGPLAPLLLPVLDPAASQYLGDKPTAEMPVSGDLNILEGGSGIIAGAGSDPMLRYTAGEATPEQLVYTVTGFGADWAGTLEKDLGNGNWVALSQYSTFTQADLDANRIRFTHSGSESFQNSFSYSVTAGGMSINNGQPQPLAVTGTFNIFVTPVNDAPVVSGSTENVISEGATTPITRDMIGLSDPDDAKSGGDYDTEERLGDGNWQGGGGTNYAIDHDTANPLRFFITELPVNGKLQVGEGGKWVDVTAADVAAKKLFSIALLTNDANSGMRYVHDGLESRSDTFKVKGIDRHGLESTGVGADVSFVIANVNDGPQIAQNPDAADAPSENPAAPNNLNNGGTPLTSVNNAITVEEGGTRQITVNDLAAYDPDSSDTQVQYRITANPAHGRLALSDDGVTFRTIGVGSAFTQADITAGRLYYIHDGSEPPATVTGPYDKFVFTLADGDKEVTDREFHINISGPANDAPIFETKPNSPVNVGAGPISVPGFSIADPDLVDGVGTGESDFVQVIVRVVDASGTPVNHATEAGGITITHAGSGLTPVGGHDGNNNYLVLQGTRNKINAALAGLAVQFTANADKSYKLQVIVDDRLRDASGALSGGANGGSVNDPGKAGGDPNIPSDSYDWGTKPIANAAASPLPLNIAVAEVTLNASSVNDKPVMVLPTDRTVGEDVRTFIGGNFDFTDAESTAFGFPIKVTLTTGGNGTLDVGGTGGQTSVGGVTISGDRTGTITLIGTAENIKALLNDPTKGLFYTSASNANHDQNEAAAGDVTITATLDEHEAALGTGGPDTLTSSFHLTITPVNDAPTVTVPSTPIVVSDSGFVAVPGFVIADPDISADGHLVGGETDVVEVTVRLLKDGTALAAGEYAGANPIVIRTTASSHGATVDSVFDGNGDALKLRGTVEQINAYLAGLQIDLGHQSNSDTTFRVEVIVDDRVRDVATGALGSGANGGAENQNGTGTPTAVITTPATVDPYSTTLPAGLVDKNVVSTGRDLFLSTVNNPADINANDVSVPEGSATIVLNASNANITVSDPDHNGGVMSVTVSVDQGFITAVSGTGGTVSGVGATSQSITIQGTQAEINSRLQALTITLPVPDHGSATPGDAGYGGANTDWNGQIKVTLVVNDQGNTGQRPGTLVGQNGQVDTNDPSTGYGDYEYVDNSDGSTNNALKTTRTFTITVTPVNDAPVLTGVIESDLKVTVLPTPDDGRTTTYVQLVKTGGVTDIDFPQASFNGGTLTVSFTNGYQAGDVLSLAGMPTGVQSVTGGVGGALIITLNADATEASLGAILEAIRYHSTSGTPGGADATALTRAFSIVLNDGNNDDGGGNTAEGPKAGLDSNGKGPNGVGPLNSVALTGTILIDLPPEAANDSQSLNKKDAGTSGNVLINDSDPNKGSLIVTGVIVGDHDKPGADPVTGKIGDPLSGAYGSLVLNADGSYTYDLNNDLDVVKTLRPGETLTEVFTYEITDPSGQTDRATLTITITGSSDAPVATDNTGAVQEDVKLTDSGNVLTDNDGNGTDHDPEGTKLTVTAVNGDVAGVGAPVGGTYGSLTLNADGSYTYTLNNSAANVQALRPGQTVTESFTYTITDEDGETATATLTITITGQNDVPVAVDDAGSVRHLVKETETGNVLPNDSDADDGASLTVVQVNGGAGNVGAAIWGSYGQLTLNADGSYSYVLDKNNPDVVALLGTTGSLLDSFTYTVSDGVGGEDTANLVITITGPGDLHATDNSNEVRVVDGGTPGIGGNILTDDDGNGVDFDPAGPNGAVDAVVSITHGSNTVQVPANSPVTISGAYGTLTIYPDGTYSYQVDDANGSVQALGAVSDTLTETFTYEIGTTDPDSPASKTATLTITIKGPGLPPVATDNGGEVKEDTKLTHVGNVIIDNDANAGVDRDPDSDPITVVGVNGAVGNIGVEVQGTYGRLIVNADGTYSYTLNNGASNVQQLEEGQTVTDSFTYTISDGVNGTATARLTITIQGTAESAVTPAPQPMPPLVTTPQPLPPTAPPAIIVPPNGPGSTPVTAFDNSLLKRDGSPSLSFLAITDINSYRLPAINPLSLTLELQDRVLAEGVQTFAIPATAFRHTDPTQKIAVEASLVDGSQLPSYIVFDPETGIFTVNTDVPRQKGVDGIDIRVKGRDSAGNEVSTTFFVAFTEAQRRNAGPENTSLRGAPADGQPREPAADRSDAPPQSDEGQEAPEQGEPEAANPDNAAEPPANSDAPQLQREGSLQNAPGEGSRLATAEQIERVGRQAVFSERDQLLADLLTLFRKSA